jgi:DNA-binding transcriptional LysR family regulator
MPASSIARRTAFGGFLDLHAAAQFLGPEVAREGDAQRQPFAALRRGLAGAATAEHRDVRRQHALGATRHDEGHALLDLGGGQLQVRAEQRGQCRRGVLAREVVDAAVALGLAHHGHDVGRHDAAGRDVGLQAAGVAGAAAGDDGDVDLVHAPHLASHVPPTAPHCHRLAHAALPCWHRSCTRCRMQHLRFLDYVDAVARAGSIRGAADQLHVAASAVNRRVQDLEAELGEPLFERLPRGVRLTSAGELFVAYARRRSADLEQVRSEIEALRGMRRGHVAIAGSQAVVPSFLPRAIVAFQALHPGITFDVKVHDRDRGVQDVLDFAVDLALVYNPDSTRGLQVLAQSKQRTCAVVAPDHPLARRAGVRLKDCLQYPIVLPAPAVGPQRARRTARQGLAPAAAGAGVQLVRDDAGLHPPGPGRQLPDRDRRRPRNGLRGGAAGRTRHSRRPPGAGRAARPRAAGGRGPVLGIPAGAHGPVVGRRRSDVDGAGAALHHPRAGAATATLRSRKRAIRGRSPGWRGRAAVVPPWLPALACNLQMVGTPSSIARSFP